MPTKRISMRDTRELLRLKWEQKLSHREIAARIGVGVGTVSQVAARAVAAGFATWAAVSSVDSANLHAALYRRKPSRESDKRTKPDFEKVAMELERSGMTLQLLHHEYVEHVGALAYSYTQFCRDYRAHVKVKRLTMRQVHAPGDKLFVDFSGMRPHYTDPTTGQPVTVELFVAVMGASNYTYVEAVRTQRIADWLGCHQRALTFLGGVPRTIVPDQLKSAVVVASRFEPGIQRSFDELAEHYGTTIWPARPRKPRDKAKVEVAVQIVQRWILMRLRKMTCFSLDELNAQIAILLVDFNAREMRRFKQSRAARFAAVDQPALGPLPATPFEPSDWQKARASLDYHVTLAHHAYSVPYQYAGQLIWARLNPTSIELFLDGHSERIALHVRNPDIGGATTNPAHRSHAHQRYADWNTERLQTWGQTQGVAVSELIAAMLHKSKHPERTFRACMGIVALAKLYPPDRLNAACARAVACGALSSRSVQSMLQHGLDRMPMPDAAPAMESAEVATHDNVRGADYYN